MIPFHLRRPRIDDYINGFLAATILTAVPFAIVAWTSIERGPAILMIAVLAILQVGAQLRFFMEYSTKRVPIEAQIGLGFAIFMAAVMIAGGIWVMQDLHLRMNP
jgi:cytochrome o ubiquinol oxidase operon protein cyoD